MLSKLAGSLLFKLVTALLTYSMYSVVLGLSFAPPVYLLVTLIPRYWAGGSPVGVLISGCLAAAALHLWFIWSAFVFSLLIRLFCKNLRPGKYPAHSLVTLRWIIGSGFYNMATKTFLPFLAMSPFLLMFYRIVGCRMGRNIWLNTYRLNDAYLMDIGDDVVLGGESVISAHIYENNQLILAPIKIGKGALIGTEAYVGPGCVIGDHAIIGMYAHLRKNTTVPPYHMIQEMGAMPVRQVIRMQRMGRGNDPSEFKLPM